MNSILNALSETVLAKPFDALNVIELQELADKHPYSPALQFLYTQKLKLENDERFHQQKQKALLYFNNPVFINYLFNSIKNSPSSLSILEESITPASIINEDSFKNELSASSTDPINEENINLSDNEELPPLPTFKIEAIDPATASLSFTPYHTIDYFAAEGIKLSESQFNNDRIGNQLKSFTDWLRQMKRLPGAQIETNISLSEEKNIEQLAQQSVHGNEADTEAMADVWLKQGNIPKAIEIYKKLSLQNPLKSAYFAAKIEFLKNKS